MTTPSATTSTTLQRSELPKAGAETTEVIALLAEFETVEAVVAAADKVREAHYRDWDVYSPFPIHGIDKVLGMRATILPWLVLGGSSLGFCGGIFMVWWINATNFLQLPTFLQGYPFLISGKPIFSFAANVPIVFETTVLLSAFAVILGMFGLNRLPMLYNPLFKSERFRRATSDRFFIVIETTDPRYHPRHTVNLLQALSGKEVEEIHE